MLQWAWHVRFVSLGSGRRSLGVLLTHQSSAGVADEARWCVGRVVTPVHMAAAEAPTMHGVLGMTRTTRALGLPRASIRFCNVFPAAIDTTSVSFSAFAFSDRTVATTCGFVATITMSTVAHTCRWSWSWPVLAASGTPSRQKRSPLG